MDPPLMLKKKYMCHKLKFKVKRQIKGYLLGQFIILLILERSKMILTLSYFKLRISLHFKIKYFKEILF